MVWCLTKLSTKAGIAQPGPFDSIIPHTYRHTNFLDFLRASLHVMPWMQLIP